MSGTGRGAFLSVKTAATCVSADSNSSEGVSVKDSGLGSRSPVSLGEYRRIGRGRLLDDLTSSCSNMSIGRDQCNPSESAKEFDECVPRGGRGRAQVFKKLFVEKAGDINQAFNSKEDTDSRKETNTCSFFSPIKRHGVKGAPVPLSCNYIRLYSDSTKGVYVYEVRFSPNIDSSNMRIKYLNQHIPKLGGTKTFDGVTLYLPILLEEKLTTFVSKSAIDNSDIEIRILFKRKESLKNCIHLYNVLFDRVMKTLNYVRFDRKQFDPTAPKIIPQSKLEVWPGYVTAVDEYEGGLMLCCDVSHRLLCQKTVLETLIEIYQANPSLFQENAKKCLLGSIVITRYNNRTYRIDNICFDKTPASKFQTKHTEISYLEYYRVNHNIEIKDKNQPLLMSIKKQKCSDTNNTEDLVFCLIPEVCYLTGLRDDIRADYKLMREIAAFTRVSPNQRLIALEKFYTNINNCPDALNILNSWGLSLKQSCKYITGRQLEEEHIYFANKTFPAGLNADFSKYAINNELLEVVHLRNWLLIHCKSDAKCAKNFCEHMDRNARSLGIQIQKPRIITLENDRVDTYVRALRNSIDRHSQVVVCICPTSRDDRYAAIKKICCTEIPIPSQVINSRTLMNETKNRAIVQKIALQINCKLGGSLWAVKIPFKNVMICGIDSYHDTVQKGNSVAAFVASLNSSYTKWYSKVVIQSKREEIVSGLCSSFTAAMIAFEKENGKLPDNVIIYREKKWNHERKKLLIEVRLRHEPDFSAKRKKRNTIWEQIMREIKEVDSTFPFSRDEATRSFINIMGTYKRIKKRNNTSGESSTNWEFFEILDEVFGSRSSVQVPSEMLECSLQTLVEDLTSDSSLTPTNSPSTMSSNLAPSDITTPRSVIKRKRCDVLDFLSKESEADAKMMKKLLDMETEKLAVEKEKVAELKEIRALFQRIAENSQ